MDRENVNCLACDKGPSVFDIRHNFTVNAVYELPFGPGKAFLNDSGDAWENIRRLELEQYRPVAHRPPPHGPDESGRDHRQPEPKFCVQRFRRPTSSQMATIRPASGLMLFPECR